jgi:pyruvate/oxaloacetate carboxyltransferase
MSPSAICNKRHSILHYFFRSAALISSRPPILLGLFGEGPAERRNRLRDVLIARGEAGLKRAADEDEMETSEEEEEEEEEKKVRPSLP